MKIDPNELRTIKVNGHPLNPRYRVGDTGVLQTDISESGQVEPALVALAGEEYFIIGGHRRAAACRALGIDIEVSVIETYASYEEMMTDIPHILRLMSSSNNREEVPVAVVVDGEIVGGHAAVAKWMSYSGANRRQIAASLGYKQDNDAASLVALHDASEKVKLAVAEGTLGLTVYGRYLRSLEPDDQDAILLTAASYSRSAIEAAYNRWLAKDDISSIHKSETSVADGFSGDDEEMDSGDGASWEPDADRLTVLGEMEAMARSIRFAGKPMGYMEKSRRNRIVEILEGLR